MTHSNHMLRPMPLKAVTIEDTFWQERIRVNRENDAAPAIRAVPKDRPD